jgi:hypothetical protein
MIYKEILGLCVPKTLIFHYFALEFAFITIYFSTMMSDDIKMEVNSFKNIRYFPWLVSVGKMRELVLKKSDWTNWFLIFFQMYYSFIFEPSLFQKSYIEWQFDWSFPKFLKIWLSRKNIVWFCHIFLKVILRKSSLTLNFFYNH